MKKLFAVAAFLLASSAAQAQYTFEYGGRTIRIDPDRGTVSIPGVYDNTGRPAKRSRDEDSDRPRKDKQRQQAKTSPQAPDPAPAEQAPGTATVPATATATVAPADTAAVPATPPANAALPPLPRQDAATAAPEAAAPVVATVPPAAASAAPQKQQAPAAQVVAAAPAANSPLGVWLTEEKEGKVRIEQCGANLCGYSVDKKSNQNGEQVLINMKPGKDAKWSGRILDPSSGSSYDSTIALKGNSLRVQGCAFSGMFCGGQTWSRVN